MQRRVQSAPQCRFLSDRPTHLPQRRIWAFLLASHILFCTECTRFCGRNWKQAFSCSVEHISKRESGCSPFAGCAESRWRKTVHSTITGRDEKGFYSFANVRDRTVVSRRKFCRWSSTNVKKCSKKWFRFNWFLVNFDSHWPARGRARLRAFAKASFRERWTRRIDLFLRPLLLEIPSPLTVVKFHLRARNNRTHTTSERTKIAVTLRNALHWHASLGTHLNRWSKPYDHLSCLYSSPWNARSGRTGSRERQILRKYFSAQSVSPENEAEPELSQEKRYSLLNYFIRNNSGSAQALERKSIRIFSHYVNQTCSALPRSLSDSSGFCFRFEINRRILHSYGLEVRVWEIHKQ